MVRRIRLWRRILRVQFNADKLKRKIRDTRRRTGRGADGKGIKTSLTNDATAEGRKEALEGPASEEEEEEEEADDHVRYRYREPNGLIKLEAAFAFFLPPSRSLYLVLARPRFDTASVSCCCCCWCRCCRRRRRRRREGNVRCFACKSPISFAHFLHFKIRRSAKEGEGKEREGERGSK